MGFEYRSEKREEPQGRGEDMRKVLPGRVSSLFQGPEEGALSRSVKVPSGEREEVLSILLA